MQGCLVTPVGDPCSRFAYETWRPVALLSLQDGEVRSRVRGVLERAGWIVVEHATGFHVVRALASLIEGRPAWHRPSLIVVDAWARGCAGLSLAAGLRELAITIPVVVVADRARDHVDLALDRHGSYVVDVETAPQLVSALARRLTARMHATATSPLADRQSAIIAYPRAGHSALTHSPITHSPTTHSPIAQLRKEETSYDHPDLS